MGRLLTLYASKTTSILAGMRKIQPERTPRKPGRDAGKKKAARPRFWLTLLILMGILVLAGLGQWDMVLAVVIGLIVGNVGSWLLGWD